jgi:hypothetical protein
MQQPGLNDYRKHGKPRKMQNLLPVVWLQMDAEELHNIPIMKIGPFSGITFCLFA